MGIARTGRHTAVDGVVRSARSARTARPARIALTAVLALTSLALAAPVTFAAPRPPGGNFQDPVVRAVDIASPAVVRIATEEAATITIQLCSRSVTLPLSGPPYQIAVTGSGTFISSDGDILTADHVVDVPNDAVVQFAAQDIANLLNNPASVDPGCQSSQAVSASDVASGNVNFNFTAHVTNVRSFAWLSTAYTGALTETTLRNVPRLDITKLTTSSFTQNDLAIVHVNMNDTPSVQLDDSSQVAVEDHLTVIGFPGNGDVNFNPSNFLTPSVNTAQVSAIKFNDNGAQLIQVGGNVEHGDSGGPVLDDAGHIIGVVSFAGPDPLGITSFLRTSDDALNLARDQGLSLTPGSFQQLWARAFGDYAATAAGHWHTAARELQQLADSYPQFLAVTPYLNYAKTAAAQENVPNAPSSPSGFTGLTALPSWLLIAAGVVALLLCVGIGLGVWLLVRRGRRKRAAKAAIQAAAGQLASTSASYPGYPAAGFAPYPGTGAPPSHLPPGASYPPAPSAGAPGLGAAGYADPAPGYPTATPPAPYPTPPAASGAARPGAAPAPSGGASVLTASPVAGGMSSASGPPSPGQPAPAMVLCANGHWFADTDARCPWCGAPPVGAPRAGSGPDTAPWG